jgi:hypothetical protein
MLSWGKYVRIVICLYPLSTPGEWQKEIAVTNEFISLFTSVATIGRYAGTRKGSACLTKKIPCCQLKTSFENTNTSCFYFELEKCERTAPPAKGKEEERVSSFRILLD